MKPDDKLIEEWHELWELVIEDLASPEEQKRFEELDKIYFPMFNHIEKSIIK
jgi:Mg2+ and Co2+ transporter CorA